MNGAVAAALLLALLPVAASAEGDADALADGAAIRAEDARRLDQIDMAYGAALRQALGGGSAADVAVLIRALAGQPRAMAPEALAGEWSCRVIKAGGIAPLLVYDAFRCRIDASDGEVRFAKLGGSQRVAGSIHQDGDRQVLLGVGHIAGDTPPPYAALPAQIDTAAVPQIIAAPGIVEMIGNDAGRILFPYPMAESLMDVLVLNR